MTLDSRELKFLIRQIDEYIQVTEIMIRKMAAMDHGELALARNLRTKLSPAKQTEHRREEHCQRARLGGASLVIDDEVRPPQEFPQYDRSPVCERLSALACRWPKAKCVP